MCGVHECGVSIFPWDKSDTITQLHCLCCSCIPSGDCFCLGVSPSLRKVAYISIRLVHKEFLPSFHTDHRILMRVTPSCGREFFQIALASEVLEFCPGLWGGGEKGPDLSCGCPQMGDWSFLPGHRHYSVLLWTF